MPTQPVLIDVNRHKTLTEYQHLFTLRAIMPHEPAPYNLHNTMFIDTISRMGTEEQKEKWLPLAESYRLVGTYAQTELGHGEMMLSILSHLGWVMVR